MAILALIKHNKKVVLSQRWSRDVLYMGALKIFGTPWLRLRPLFPTFLMGFCSNRPCECAYKIWSSSLYLFLRGGSQNISGNPWAWLCPLTIPQKIPQAFHYKFLCVHSFIPIFDGSFGWGLRIYNLGEGGAGGLEWKKRCSVPIL